MLEVTRAPAAVNAAPAPISSFHRPYGPRIHRDENAASAAPGPSSSTELPADAPAAFDSPSSAASYLASLRYKKPKEAAPVAAETAEAPEPATADPESPPGDADPAEEPILGEEPEDAEPASKEPPIERPRSWTKDEDAEWQTLPRAVQQKIVAREQERDKGTRQSQNEAAEARKAAQAERAQAEQARTQYEEKAQGALKVLEREQLRDFPDVKNSDDVKNLLVTDPLRYLQWDAHQKEMWAATNAVQEAEKSKIESSKSDWTKFVQEQNALAIEHIPELADKAKSSDLMAKAASKLRDAGFTDKDLDGFSNGEKISIFDNRIQRILFDAVRYSAAKAAVPKAAPKPVPPVQKPGITQPRAAEGSAALKLAESNFKNSGSLKDAVALRQARARFGNRA